ncbi:hypothetical protein [Yinghuangia seranimata]|uniref:hypothetical protein n=1 Tax=Yinghuangia seranimata TaxID=408067 RepID=UPI00248AC664|nr:hypothetical protein [Yinghuangia seranimata]MDI2126100.1 hypothetical protein [Yinghuangia seranimata]
MTDDLDRLLKGLADDIEPAVRIGRADDARARGRRITTRRKVTAAAAAVAAVAVIASTIAVLGSPDGSAQRASTASGSPTVSVSPSVPGALPTLPEPKMSCTPRPDGSRPCDFREPDPVKLPLSPRVLGLADLPKLDGATWTQAPDAAGSVVTRADTLNGTGSGTFLPRFATPFVNRLHPDIKTAETLDLPGDTSVLSTVYHFSEAAGGGHFVEKIVPVASEEEAKAAMAKFAASLLANKGLADAGNMNGAQVTKISVTDTVQVWGVRWTDPWYNEVVAFGRSGNTIVTFFYQQSHGDLITSGLTPEFFQSAVTRAASVQ